MNLKEYRHKDVTYKEGSVPDFMSCHATDFFACR